MREHTGPAFPNPTAEEVRRMPEGSPAQLEDKRIAARKWLAQFCERTRFVVQARDLRVESRTNPRVHGPIDLVRKYLTDAEIDAALRGT